MKAVCLFALCLMAGVVSSEFAWKVGKSYTYAVRGRVMSGITEINTQYAGLEMNYNVILNVVGHNTLVLKPTHIKLIEVNDKIHGGWRDGEIRGEHTVELTEEFRMYLESPIEFTLEQGIVTSLKVENNLPLWAINMKKAQVSHFILDTTGVNVVIKGNLDRKTNNVRPEVLKHEAGFFYETMEKTVHGECKTYYTVSQNMPFVPPFQYQKQSQPSVHSVESHSVESNEFIHHDILEKIEADSREEHHVELPWHNTFHQFCNEHDQVYEIIKTVNFTDCVQKPVLGHFSPTASKYVHAAENGAGSFGHRVLVSRYLACGIDRKHFTILRVRQEEQMKIGTHLVKKMIAGAVQNITLIEVVDTKTVVHLKNPIVVKNLIYTFHHEQGLKDTTTFTKNIINRMDSSEELPQMDAAFINHKSSEEIEIENIKTRFPEILENNMLPMPTLEDAPLNGLLASPLKIEGMKRRIDQLMREIVEDLTKTTGKETLAEKETLSKISTIAKILRFFSYTDVKEIYHRYADKKQTEEDKTRRNIIIDAISIAGTNPNIKVLIDLIKNKVIVGERAARVIMTFPMYIRTPTIELLKELLILVKTAPVDVEYVQIKTTAALALSTLLHQACVNTHIRNTRYPVAIYGHFCDAQVVETEFLPYFVEQLEKVIVSDVKEDSHWKNLWMTVLGNIGHPRIVPVVQRLMDTLVNPFHKVRVIYMLKHLIVARTSVVVPELKVHKMDVLTREIVEKKVLPILISAAFDKGEHPEVRMAAISLLFHCNCVDVTLWQQLAFMTWFEVSQEVHSFVYNTLKNLAELKTWTNELNYKLVKNARYVLTICKPITAGLTKSRNIFVTDFIQEHLSGFFTKLSYWGSKDSMIPNNIHYKNLFQYGNGAYDEVPLEFSLHGHTIQKLINHLLEQVYTPSTTDREAHEDLAQIREILGIKERKQTDKVEGQFYVKIQNEMERMFSFDKHTLEKLIKQFNAETLPKLRTGYPIHFQKTLHLREHLMEVPTIFGFPCTYNFRMPVHVSVRGLVKLVSEDNKDFQIQAELHPVYAWKTHEKLSFKVPFVGKKYQTGFQRHVVSEFPFRALVRLAPRGQIEVAVTPAHLKRDELHQINLVTFHQKPYTVIVTDSLWPTAHKEGGVMKIVKAVETPYKKELNFGKNILGLALKLESETHYKIQNEGKTAWMHYFNRFHSLTSILNLNWMGEPSLRLSKRQLTLDMTESETKTLVFVIGKERKMKTVDTLVKESSEEIHSSEEKLTEKNVRHVAIAIIGKKTPITTIFRTTGIQKVLEKGTTTTVQYLLELLWTNGHLKVQVGAGKAAKEIALTLKETSPALMAIREAIVECPIMDIQHDICVHWENKYERPIWANRHELIVLRKRLLAEELVVKVQSELKFGKTCTQLPHFIKMVGNLKRDEEMTEWALNKSPKALKCIEDEKKGFTVSPVCLWVSEQQAAALNKVHLEFNYGELPTLLKNYLFQVEDYVKTILFPSMFHDRFPVEAVAGDKKLIVDFRMTPNKEFFNLHIIKPTTRLTFDNVKVAQWLKMILPLTSTQNIFENVRDRTLRFYSEPSCTLEGKFINTFDNVTYKFAPHVVEKCQHVLTQDCSGKYPMTVLVKDINTEKKVVTVLLGGKTKIEIIPQGALINKGILVHTDVKTEFIVLINGRQVENFPEVVRLPETHNTWYHNYIAKVEVMVNGGIQVITPRIRIATDAARVVVYGSNVYRNRTCGLCGNFDGEKVAELRSPKNCPLSSGSLLVASYAFPPLHAKEQGLCKIDSEIKKRVEMEENDCKINRVHIPKYTFDVETMDIDVDTKKVNDYDCEINERLVRRVEGLGLCKSELVVRRCTEGCVAKSVVPRKMWFNCTQKKSTIYSNERVIRKSLMIDEPTVCVRDL